MKERKDLIIYLVMVAILFGGGLGLGYYIWGMNKQKKPDYKKYLKNTINYLATIEDKNVMLSKETKSLKNDIGLLNKKVSEERQKLEKLSKSLQAKISDLEKVNADIRSVMNEKMILADENISLKKKMQEITEEFDAFRQKTGELEKTVTGSDKNDTISTQEDEQEQVKEDTDEKKTEMKEPKVEEENKKFFNEQRQTDEEGVE
jgi:chromosome segregation ATPase